MQLEDYFELETLDSKLGPVERIRLKGHRIDIADVIRLFKEGMSAERIRQRFPTLSLEQVYGTITYYLQHGQEMDDYIVRGEKVAEAFYQEWLANQPPAVARLRALKARQQTGQAAS